MAEHTGAEQQKKSKSSLLRNVSQKQPVSTYHDLAEDHALGNGILQQRAAVRRVSSGTLSREPAQTTAYEESRFAHDLSQVRTHTVSPSTRPAETNALTPL